jgi:D-alanine-D-alanine ligase
MRVAILYNAIPDDASLEDQDLLVQVDSVASALRSLGHEPTPISCTLDLAAMRENLLRLRPDVVFNLVESLAEADSLVYLPHAVLDVLELPYAGNRTEALFLTTHKLLAKERLRSAGLPTPAWLEFFAKHSEPHDKEIPLKTNLPSHCLSAQNQRLSSQNPSASWILKGVWDQASRGMNDDAVMHDAEPAAVQKRLQERVEASGRPCFAEQYIEGREFNLSLLTGSDGPMVLPPAEIDFSAFPPEKPRIVGHRAKWEADSFEYNNTPRRFDRVAGEPVLAQKLQSLALQCWPLFRLRGWARVDFRVDAAGNPWILEINANPCLSPDAGFAAALHQVGISFDEAIQRILAEAIAECRKR